MWIAATRDAGQPEDRRLVKGVMSGNRAALSRLVEKCLPQIKYLGKSSGIDTASAVRAALWALRESHWRRLREFRFNCGIEDYVGVVCAGAIGKNPGTRFGGGHAAHAWGLDDDRAAVVFALIDLIQALSSEASPREAEVVSCYRAKGWPVEEFRKTLFSRPDHFYSLLVKAIRSFPAASAEAVENPDRCSPEDVIESVRDRFASAQGVRLISHLATCSFCATTAYTAADLRNAGETGLLPEVEAEDTEVVRSEVSTILATGWKSRFRSLFQTASTSIKDSDELQ
jgi:hypothetical protein